MQPIAATLCLVSLVAASAVAADGFYLEEELVRSSAGQEPRVEIARTWFVEGKLRKEEGASGTVTIFRDDLELVWVIDRGRRTYFELSREVMDAMGKMSMSVLVPDAAGEEPSTWLQRTGRTRRIGDWQAYEVRVEDRPLPGVRVEMWLSEDVPIGADFKLRFGRTLFDDGNPAAQLLAGLRELPGHPVDVRLTIQLGPQRLEMSQRLKRFEPRPIESSQFDLPVGFARVANPFEAPAEAAGSGTGKR